ncbi:hypothetical protein [Pseudoalteromonas marina]|uniref:hypothetical protein n=1 Tax=Pseudoalteromonas marina TaxID=267375 RepID=UPI003C4AA6F7
MRHSVELSTLVARHLQGKKAMTESDIFKAVIDFNHFILKMREGESTIHNAMDKLDNDNKRRA